MAGVNTQLLLALVAGYLLGSIPTGYLIGKIWNIDIRRYGSGNIGATNILRIIGPFPGTLVFLLDLSKGLLAVIIAQQVFNSPLFVVLTGLAAILGNMYSVFLQFQGGRGVATGSGVLLGIAQDIFLAALIFAILVIFLTRYVSLASLLTPIFVAAAFFLLKRPLPYTLAAGAASLFIIARHLPNIQRLLNKSEPRIGETNA
jgi:glycerol-3-phosphate acyltransferase PlsY